MNMLKFYLKFTAKNLFRHKRRTILTALAIAIGIMYFIVFDSMLAGADQDAISNLVNFETGHLQVSSVTSDDKRPKLDELIPDGERLAGEIRNLPKVEAATPRLVFPASAIAGFEELPVLGIGADPETDEKVFMVPEYITDGKWFMPGEEGVVLGKRIADLLELEPGDMITLRTQTVDMTFQAVDLSVVGIVSTPHPTVNQAQVFLPLDVAQEALGAGESATTIIVRTESEQAISAVSDSIQGLDLWNPSWKIKPWYEATSFLAIGTGKRAFGGVLMGLVLIIATIGVVNSILLSTLERVREIGLLKAMGMKEKEIVQLFVFEGCGLGLLGGILGAAMATVINVYLVNTGLSLKWFMGETNMDIGYPIADRMFGVWNWPTVLWAILFGLLVSLVASYFPARRAAYLDSVESLRQV
jgi:putative ABC transport system permease protein